MVRSISSSSTEYASAKESPERNGSSGSSAVEYHSANEDPIAVLEQMKISDNDIDTTSTHPITNESSSQSPFASELGDDESESRPGGNGRSEESGVSGRGSPGPSEPTVSKLSAAAPDFVPQTQRALSTIVQETILPRINYSSFVVPDHTRDIRERMFRMFPERPPAYRTMAFSSSTRQRAVTETSASSSSTSTTAPSSLPVYSNGMPDIPSHWVPLYGAAHGMFYDSLTKLFHGDGPPRPTLERPGGGMPPTDTSIPIPRIGGSRYDQLHIQPISLTQPATLRLMSAVPPPNAYFFCHCRKAWLPYHHNCPDKSEPANFVMPSPPPGASIAIRPGDRLPDSWITHQNPVRDTGYLTPEQRAAFQSGLRITTPTPRVLPVSWFAPPPAVQPGNTAQTGPVTQKNTKNEERTRAKKKKAGEKNAKKERVETKPQGEQKKGDDGDDDAGGRVEGIIA